MRGKDFSIKNRPYLNWDVYCLCKIYQLLHLALKLNIWYIKAQLNPVSFCEIRESDGKKNRSPIHYHNRSHCITPHSLLIQFFPLRLGPNPSRCCSVCSIGVWPMILRWTNPTGMLCWWASGLSIYSFYQPCSSFCQPSLYVCHSGWFFSKDITSLGETIKPSEPNKPANTVWPTGDRLIDLAQMR